MYFNWLVVVNMRDFLPIFFFLVVKIDLKSIRGLRKLIEETWYPKKKKKNLCHNLQSNQFCTKNIILSVFTNYNMQNPEKPTIENNKIMT